MNDLDMVRNAIANAVLGFLMQNGEAVFSDLYVHLEYYDDGSFSHAHVMNLTELQRYNLSGGTWVYHSLVSVLDDMNNS